MSSQYYSECGVTASEKKCSHNCSNDLIKCILSDAECNSHCRVVTKNYQHVLALVFAVEEINANDWLLPNITLGFHIYDSNFNARQTHRAVMELLSTQSRFFPNYKYGTQNKLISVIGALYADISLCVANILGLYKTPQVVMNIQ